MIPTAGLADVRLLAVVTDANLLLLVCSALSLLVALRRVGPDMGLTRANTVTALLGQVAELQRRDAEREAKLGALQDEVKVLRERLRSVVASAARHGIHVTERYTLRMERGQIILVVDDDPDRRAMLQTVLDEAGYEIYCAPDQAEALRLAETYPLSAAILDVYLRGGTNGVDVARALRALPGRAHLPVIFATALDDVATRRLLRQFDAQAVVRLPLDRLEDLEQIVRSVVASGEAQHAG